jgi:DNA-binding MurR/RpiR family transcriptional regulator
MAAPDVARTIEDNRHGLTPAERRVAEVVLTDPEAVAFGTVAALADRARTSGATVVRLATRLGYAGFVGLQAGVQADLARRLRPASERIRQPVTDDALGATLALEIENLRTTLDGVDRAAFGEAVAMLAGTGRRSRSPGEVFVVAGDACQGVAVTLATELGLLRPGVEFVTGSEVQVARSVAHADRHDLMVAIDVRRYDRWVLDVAGRAKARGVRVIALTDGLLSPLAAIGRPSFVVSAAGAGPFDSHVGTLALVNALLSAVAVRLRATATARLDRVEAAWGHAGALVER